MGCGGSDTEGSGATTGTTSGSTGSGGSSATSCEPEGAADVPDVSGLFAYYEVTSRLVVVPGFSDPFHTRVVTLLLVDQTLTGQDVAFNAEYCDHYTEDPDLAVHVVIPKAYTDSLPPFTRPGTYAKTGGAYRLALPELYQVEGATLADPVNEALPTAPDDPRVVDQDSDGKPGLTLRLTGLVDGEIYVVQRGFTKVDGGPQSADELKGPVTFESEQVILASDPPTIKDLASQATTDNTPCASYFRMVRVPAGSDCTYVNDNFATLFP